MKISSLITTILLSSVFIFAVETAPDKSKTTAAKPKTDELPREKPKENTLRPKPESPSLELRALMQKYSTVIEDMEKSASVISELETKAKSWEKETSNQNSEIGHVERLKLQAEKFAFERQLRMTLQKEAVKMATSFKLMQKIKKDITQQKITDNLKMKVWELEKAKLDVEKSQDLKDVTQEEFQNLPKPKDQERYTVPAGPAKSRTFESIARNFYSGETRNWESIYKYSVKEFTAEERKKINKDKEKYVVPAGKNLIIPFFN